MQVTINEATKSKFLKKDHQVSTQKEEKINQIINHKGIFYSIAITHIFLLEIIILILIFLTRINQI